MMPLTYCDGGKLPLIKSKAINSAVWSYQLPGTGGNSEFGTGVSDLELMAAYANNDVVYSSVEYNSTAVSMAPWKLLTKNPLWNKSKCKKLSTKEKSKFSVKANGDVSQIFDHPIIDILTTTSDDLTGFQILKATSLQLEVFGRAYWLLNDSNEPTSIRVLKSYYVQPIRSAEGDVIGYDYTNVILTNGVKRTETTKLEVDEVIDFRNVSISDLYGGGTSWLRACFAKTKTNSKYQEYMDWVVDNRARPDALITPKTDMLQSDEAEKLQQKFIDRAGRRNNGKPIVLEQAVSYHPLNYQPNDVTPLQFNEQHENSVYRAAGIPVPLMKGDENNANMQTCVEWYRFQTVRPKLQLIQEVLNRQFVSKFGDEVWIEFENPIPDDENLELEVEKAKTTRVQAMGMTGSFSDNDIREVLGFETRPEPEADELRASTANAPVLDSEPDPEPKAAETPKEPANGLETTGKSIVGDLLRINKSVSKGQLDRSTAINLVVASLGIDQAEARNLVTYPPEPKTKGRKTLKPVVLPPGDPKIAQILKDQWQVQKEHYLNQLGDSKSKARVDGDGLPTQFIPSTEWDDDIAKKVKPLIEVHTAKSADDRLVAYKRAGAIPDVPNIPPKKIEESVNKASLKFAQSTNETTAKNLNDALDQLRAEIKEGLSEGDNLDDMRDRVQKVFESADDDRADLIAETETSRAVHEGQRIAAKESGVVKGFKLLVSDDCCDECADLAGTEVDLDGSFGTDDYDDSLLPCHPSCRCTCTEILDTDDDD